MFPSNLPTHPYLFKKGVGAHVRSPWRSLAANSRRCTVTAVNSVPPTSETKIPRKQGPIIALRNNKVHISHQMLCMQSNASLCNQTSIATLADLHCRDVAAQFHDSSNLILKRIFSCQFPIRSKFVELYSRRISCLKGH